MEVKNIIPPTDIQNAMEKQMRAERERREAILRAEGEKTSSILVSEGKKQSLILEAEAEKLLLFCGLRQQKKQPFGKRGASGSNSQSSGGYCSSLRMIKEQELSKEVIAVRS